MKRDEKKLYQVNKLSYNLTMLFVLINTVHAIFTLQNMAVNYKLGIFIMVTILISMLSFLTAVKLQTYSLSWSYVSIGIGVFQILKLVLAPSEIEGSLASILAIMVYASMLFIITGAIIAIIRIKKRTHYLENHYSGKEVMHK